MNNTSPGTSKYCISQFSRIFYNTVAKIYYLLFMCHYMQPSHANISKPHLYDMLALRMEIKIQHGQTIQNARYCTHILKHFHVSHTWLHGILLVKQAGDFLTILYTCIWLLKMTGIKNNCVIIATSFVAAELALPGEFNFPIFIVSVQIKFSALTILD